VAQFCYVAEKGDEAMAGFRRICKRYLETFADAVQSWQGKSSDQYPGYDKMVASILATTPEKIVQQGGAFVGTPEDVAGQVQACIEMFGVIEPSMQISFGGSKDEEDDAITIGDAKLVARRVSGLEKDALRGLSDSLRDRLGSGVVVLASETDGKVALVVSVTKDLTTRIQAGRLVKELAPIVGGGGGGRPDFAEAGGKDSAKIDELLAKAPEVVRALLA